jgi:hypothetical protein
MSPVDGTVRIKYNNVVLPPLKTSLIFNSSQLNPEAQAIEFKRYEKPDTNRYYKQLPSP